MELNHASEIFAALGHSGRLSVFRMLMRLAPKGGRPTEIAAALGMKSNTLSHHLADLESCGLIQSTREGRSLIYSVNMARTAGLVGYLVDDCCRGRPDLACPAPEPSLQTGTYNVIFICSGNSARSIFAEAILNHVGADKFRAFSAGTRPSGAANPFALEVLRRNGVETAGLRAKHLSEFETPDAPQMDFVFTVCDAAAAEECAPWAGQPLTAHWGLPDPVKATGTEAEKALAFARSYADLFRRIKAFAALPLPELDRLSLQARLDAIALSKD